MTLCQTNKSNLLQIGDPFCPLLQKFKKHRHKTHDKQFSAIKKRTTNKMKDLQL